jgi:hypothetical protein
MALILSPEPMPVEVTDAVEAVGVAVVVAAVVAAVDAAPDIVELMLLPVPSQDGRFIGVIGEDLSKSHTSSRAGS